MRRLTAALLAGLAACAGTLAWSSWVATSTVLDPSRTDRVAEVLVTDPAIRRSVEDGLTRALVAAVPPGTAVPDAELRLAAQRAFDDPRVQAVLRTAIVDAHRRLLGEGTGPVQLDAGIIAVAGRDALLAAHPELRRMLPTPPPLAVELPTEGLPDLGGIREAASGLPKTAAQASAILFAVAFLVAADRSRVLRRAGAFGLWTGGGWFALGWLVPWAVSHWSVDGRLGVMGSLALAVARPMMVPAALLVALGVALLLAASTWAKASAARRAAKAPEPASVPLWQPARVSRLTPPPAIPLGHSASKVDINSLD
ncbi:MAG: hypothetical protein ACRD0C_11355 [Acidimicrobiia bacterium]